MIFFEELFEIVRELNKKYFHLRLETNGDMFNIRYIGMLIWSSETSKDDNLDYIMLKDYVIKNVEIMKEKF
jgi:hypothetical protein